MAQSDDVLAPVERFYEKLTDFNPEVSYQEYVERVARISTNNDDLAFPVAPLLAYLSFLPESLTPSMKPDLTEIYPAGEEPFTAEQMDLIFDDLVEEELSGEKVVDYLVEVLREVAGEMKKSLN